MDIDATIEALKLELVEALEIAIAEVIPPDERTRRIAAIEADWPVGMVVHLRSNPTSPMTVQRCMWEVHTNREAVEVVWLDLSDAVRNTLLHPSMIERHIEASH